MSFVFSLFGVGFCYGPAFKPASEKCCVNEECSAKVKSLLSLPLLIFGLALSDGPWGQVQGAPPMSCSSDDWQIWVSSLKTMKTNKLGH